MWGSLCRGAKDPITTVAQLRARDPLPNTVTFFDRVKFIMESKNGLQSNADATQFHEK